MNRKRKRVVRDFSCRYHGQRDCICPCMPNSFRFVDPATIQLQERRKAA
jgi:predicted protein tyrosine phosphatase